MTDPEIVDVDDYQLAACNDPWPTLLTTDWTDNCSEGGTGIQSDGGVDDGESEDGCIQYRLYTFNITDDCGNSDEETTRVSREYDMTDPEIVDVDDYQLAACNDPWPTLLTTDWTDNCSEGGTGIQSDGGVDDGESEDGCIQYRLYTFNITDDCGNSDEETTRVSREYDMTDPEIIGVGEGGTIECTDDVVFSNPTATDNCDDDVDLDFEDETNEGECADEYSVTRTWTATDDCGNTSTASETIYVQGGIGDCDTAFGRLTPEEQCFIDDEDYNFNRWGWTNYIAGESEVPYIMPLYAGAAHCDINNGALVGEIEVLYLDGEVTVTYYIDSGYVMSEAHVYIGCDKYPLDSNGNPTVAPGQYNFNLGALDNVNEYYLGPVDVTGPFYIIAHAKVCELICSCSDPNNGGGQGSDEDPIECGPSSLTEVVFGAYPVPFDGIVNIGYTFDYDTNISIEVFDIRGMLVKKLADSYYSNGTNGTSRIDFEGTSNQIYFIKLTTDRGVSIKKVVSSHTAKKK